MTPRGQFSCLLATRQHTTQLHISLMLSLLERMSGQNPHTLPKSCNLTLQSMHNVVDFRSACSQSRVYRNDPSDSTISGHWPPKSNSSLSGSTFPSALLAFSPHKCHALLLLLSVYWKLFIEFKALWTRLHTWSIYHIAIQYVFLWQMTYKSQYYVAWLKHEEKHYSWHFYKLAFIYRADWQMRQDQALGHFCSADLGCRLNLHISWLDKL